MSILLRRHARLMHLASPVSLTATSSGQDLAGNTFWEFKATKDAARLRRIVKFDPRTHYADVKVAREFDPRRKITRLLSHPPRRPASLFTVKKFRD